MKKLNELLQGKFWTSEEALADLLESEGYEVVDIEHDFVEVIDPENEDRILTTGLVRAGNTITAK